MSRHHHREYIICYDIANPRRLGKIHRMLKRLALPLQYSVFYTRMSEHQRDRLASLLDSKIDPKLDDVRIYPLPNGYNIDYLGCKPFLEGLHLDRQSGQWTDAIEQALDREARRRNRTKEHE